MVNKEIIYKRRDLCKMFELGKITKEQYEKDFAELTTKIYHEFREECKTVEIEPIKQKIYSVNQLKKEVAQFIHNALLKNNFTKDECKGIFRAGYKMLR